MKFENIPITYATKNQLEELLLIRNIKGVRENMFSSELISLSNHLNWCNSRISQFEINDCSYLVTLDHQLVRFLDFGLTNSLTKVTGECIQMCH